MYGSEYCALEYKEINQKLQMEVCDTSFSVMKTSENNVI